MNNKKILGLFCVFLFLWGCAGLISDWQDNQNTMFPNCSKREVMQACLDYFLERSIKVTLCNMETGFIQAEDTSLGSEWGIKVLEGRGGSSLSVTFHKQPNIYGGAFRSVSYFIKGIQKRLGETEEFTNLTERRGEEKRFYEDYSVEELWQAAVDALTDCGYTITVSDRIAGVLRGIRKPRYASAQNILIFIRISEESGKVQVNCSVSKTRADFGASISTLFRDVFWLIEKNLEDR